MKFEIEITLYIYVLQYRLEITHDDIHIFSKGSNFMNITLLNDDLFSWCVTSSLLVLVFILIGNKNKSNTIEIKG